MSAFVFYNVRNGEFRYDESGRPHENTESVEKALIKWAKIAQSCEEKYHALQEIRYWVACKNSVACDKRFKSIVLELQEL
jgi:thiosulfate reductase cytochrome b subunit